jgi:hypothetical protein
VSGPAVHPRSIARLLPWLALAASGFSLAVLFHAGYWLPLRGGIVLLATLAVGAVLTVGVSRLSLLPRFMLLLYCLPFTVLLGYLLNPAFSWHYTEHGMNISRDPVVMRQLVAMGMIGLLGLYAGMRWAAIQRGARIRHGVATSRSASGETLADPIFYGLVPVAVLLSWLSAPRESIFEAVYAAEQSDALSATINFPAAYMLSYILIVVLLVDAERESSPARRRMKLMALGAATAYIVIVL